MSQLVLTNKFERLAEKGLHGLNVGGVLDDPATLEVALFNAQPAAEDETDFTNEIAVTGYERKPVTFKEASGNDGAVNVEEILFDGHDVTDASTDTVTHMGIARKQSIDIAIKGDAGDTKQLAIPSISAENLHTGTITGTAAVSGQFSYDPLPPYPRHVYGNALTLVDSGASFSATEITQNEFGVPTTYLIVSSGILRGMKIIIWGRIDANTLLLDLHGDVAIADALVGASYVVRKFPTLASVFGTSLGDLQIVGASAKASADNIRIHYSPVEGLNFQNVTHDRTNFKLVFDNVNNTVDPFKLDDIVTGDTMNFIDIVFPNDPSMTPKRVYNFSFQNGYTELVYADADNPDLGDAEYAIASSVDNVRAYKPGWRGSSNNHEQERVVWFNDAGSNGTVGWREGTQFTVDVSDLILPVFDIGFAKSEATYNAVNMHNLENTAGDSNNPALMHVSVLGGADTFGPLGFVEIQLVANTDTSVKYDITRTLPSELMWYAELLNPSQTPAPLPYNKNNSIRFEAEKLKFYMD